MGQCFLFDKNLLGKLLETAEVSADQTVLEVGPGTGSLTEELVRRARQVLAVEMDQRLAELLRQQLGDVPNFRLICRDVLAGKHALSPEVLSALPPRAVMVSNLPYSIATPLIAEMLRSSWRAAGGAEADRIFERMTFTVQKEVADRLIAGPGSADYGPVSVLVRLLGEVRPGRAVPASAFWPRPKVDGQIVRIDFDAESASAVSDIDALAAVLSACFTHRRKQLSSIARLGSATCGYERLRTAVERAGVDPALRAGQVTPEQYRDIANAPK